MSDPEFQNHTVSNQIVYDKAGNAVGVVLDGSVYRLQGENTVVGKTAGAGANKEVSVIDDTEDANVKRIQTENRFAPNQVLQVTQSVIPVNPANFIQDKLREPGTSPDMVVDGSGTPVEFSFDADPSDDLLLFELRIIISALAIDFTGSKFANLAKLTNGVKIDVRSNSVTAEIFNIKQNENFLELISPAGVFLDKESTNDVLAIGLNFGANVPLIGGSGDFVKITIRDDLVDVGALAIDYFQATQWAVKVT